MRILYIDVNYKNSSTGDIVYNMKKCCDKHNIISAVCYGRGQKVNEENVYKFGLDFETYIHAFLTRVTGYTGCYSYFSTKRLIKYIKKFNPDIVHIHELHAYFVNVKQLLIFLKTNKIPTVFTNHCEFLYTGKCGYSKYCNKYIYKCGNCPLLKEYPKSILFDHTSYMLDVKKDIFKNWHNVHIVSPSNWIKQKAMLSFLNDKPNTVIYNAIDTDVFKYNAKTTNKKTVLLIAPHIFSKIKGGYKVLSIAQKMIDTDINFILIGADKPFPNVPKNVKVYGHIYNKKELANLYSNADVFLILSEYENFPTTSIEAQCCGTKVIGYDVGGIKETILEHNGYTTKYLDDKTIIKNIKIVLDEKYDKQTVSENSIKTFSFDNMFNKYLTIYKKLCN